MYYLEWHANTMWRDYRAIAWTAQQRRQHPSRVIWGHVTPEEFYSHLFLIINFNQYCRKKKKKNRRQLPPLPQLSYGHELGWLWLIIHKVFRQGVHLIYAAFDKHHSMNCRPSVIFQKGDHRRRPLFSILKMSWTSGRHHWHTRLHET